MIGQAAVPGALLFYNNKCVSHTVTEANTRAVDLQFVLADPEASPQGYG